MEGEGGVCSKGMWRVLGGAPMQICDFSLIASWLSLDLYVGVGDFLRVCCVLLGHLSVGLLLGDCFCEIITCHYCFFCMYYFNVVHVLFYVMRNSANCDIKIGNVNIKMKFEKDGCQNASFQNMFHD